MIYLSVATEPSLVPRSGIDVRAFLRSNTSLLKEEQNDTLKNIVGNRVPHDGIYHWKVDPAAARGWSEEVCG